MSSADPGCDDEIVFNRFREIVLSHWACGWCQCVCTCAIHAGEVCHDPYRRPSINCPLYDEYMDPVEIELRRTERPTHSASGVPLADRHATGILVNPATYQRFLSSIQAIAPAQMWHSPEMVHDDLTSELLAVVFWKPGCRPEEVRERIRALLPNDEAQCERLIARMDPYHGLVDCRSVS